MTTGSPTTMTRVLDGPSAEAAAALLPHAPRAEGVTRIAVVLDDLAGDDGRPLGVALIDLPPGRAGVLVGMTGHTSAVTARLLSVGADHLRALGRLRLTTSSAADAPTDLAAYLAAGFRRVRQHADRIDLALEL